jgi:diguanylate cyclase (GGDEF)-like protein
MTRTAIESADTPHLARELGGTDLRADPTDPTGYGRPARGVHPAIDPPPGSGRLAELALRIQHDIDNCSGELLALATDLRRSAARQNAAPAPTPSSCATRMARSGVIACALELRRLVALLDAVIQRANIHELGSLAVRDELQQARLRLLQSQVREQQARHQACHDSLTGLPNRFSFEERSSHTLARHRQQPRPFALMYLDLDGFKSINDTHGHAVGDELLKIIGSRLTHAVRAQDSISRQRGDEFLCLLLNARSDRQVSSIARKLIDAVSAPCQLGPITLRVTASIGIALYPADGITIEALLDRADQAMFWAKQNRLGHALSRHVPAQPDCDRGAGQDQAVPPVIQPSSRSAASGSIAT